MSHRTAEPAFVLTDVAVRYGATTAISDVSVEIPRGGITALVGPSGCGKTSLLSVLNRLTDLIPGCEVTGTASFDAENLLDPRLDTVALRRRVGMIFQSPNPFPFSIRRNIELPLREHGFDRRETRMRDALDAVGLWDEVEDRLDTNAQELSGGQQQRLCIARALALQPEVLLLDEPCSALDPISSGVVEDLIASLRDDYTLLIVTHNLAQARRIADNVGFFWTDQGVGKLIEFGSTERLFEAPQHELTAAYVAGARG